MNPIDRAVLAERTLMLERHLARVAEKLPTDADGLVAGAGDPGLKIVAAATGRLYRFGYNPATCGSTRARLRCSSGTL